MPDSFSAQAAGDILAAGGNAVDAAICAAFVLAVTYPEAGNIGGGGFMLSYMDGEPAFLDFRETAPSGASRDMYLDEGGNFIQQASLVGGKASGIPGTVRGMQAAHQRYGSMPWTQLLQPAIDLAREGFLAHPHLAQLSSEKVLELDGASNFERYFGAIKANQLFKQSELAATLERIAKDPDDFYTGTTARQLVAQMKANGGIINLADLAAYRAQWRQPLQRNWRGLTVLTSPPPSSGGVALLQLLKMRDFADAHLHDLWHNSPRYIHILAEIEKQVFADRAEYLGDPDFVSVPVDALLENQYLTQRAAQINAQSISPVAQISAGLESTDTTHFSVLDSKGNAVSLTYTLNWDFGSGSVVAGAGFLLNNEMDDFSAKVGVANKFGVIGGQQNAIAPGKRMLSSMTPTIVLDGDKPTLILGTPGGSTIFTSVFQVMLNLYDYNMPLQQAVDATRFHHQLFPAKLIVHDQREISTKTRDALEAMGYTVEPNSWGDLGDIQAILSKGGLVQAAADNRARGVARTID